jgi:hypothetical protein
MESMHSEKGMQRQKISEEKMPNTLPASVSTTRVSTIAIIVAPRSRKIVVDVGLPDDHVW